MLQEKPKIPTNKTTERLTNETIKTLIMETIKTK